MVPGETAPERVSGTGECARPCRTAAAASLRCALGEGAAGCSLATRALACGLVVAAGFAVIVFVGLAAAALLVAADAAGPRLPSPRHRTTGPRPRPSGQARGAERTRVPHA